MRQSDYKIENVYEPGYDSFKPNEDSPFLGKNGMIPVNQLGLGTDPRVANQVAALSQALNQGISVMEIGTLSPQVFETIPKQHFAEMRRKAKLAEAQITLHAPIQGTDPSGFGQQGYEESNRLSVERQLRDVIDKAIEMDSKGNMPITIHGSNAAGSTFKYITNEEGEREKVTDMLVAVDRESGQLRPLKEDVSYIPDFGVSKIKYSPEKKLEVANRTMWEDQIDKIEFQKVNVDNILSKIPKEVQIMAQRANQDKEYFKQLAPNERDLVLKVNSASSYLEDIHRSLNSTFSKAYEFGNEDQKKELEKLSKEFAKDLYGVDPDKFKSGKLSREEEMLMSRTYHDFQNQANSMQIFAEKLKKVNPGMLQDIESFSVSKASDTFSNVAFYAYEKKGDKAPALSIENLYQEMGFSQGDDLKNLVVTSRKKLIDNLVKQKGLSAGKAEEVAAKLIGVTFDVGHLNMSKKYGYKDEELVKEAKQVKKFINKVHLTDNFGFNDTHLPPGMGNVPFQALLEAIGEEGAKAIKINEVGGWFEHFKSSPFPQILEAYGSPVYSTGSGPSWSQAAGFQQSYLEGYGQMLPPTHYQLFGAGFSQLPESLGGQQGQQGGGRMGGGGF
ncbi:MAG TPA: sugar phosphate isomerase/epimerase [Nanoarchaeota archaeon]|nr:sugar phosphate isomerase/epimerase [Nanoarchaeota archaeon]